MGIDHVGIVGTVVRAHGWHLPLVVALTLAFTVLELEIIPPDDTPTEMWATHAAAFLWTAVVWDGRSRPGRELHWHLAAQLVLFLAVALGFGWGLLDALWMGAVNILGGVLLLVVFARLRRDGVRAPLDAVSNLLLLALSFVVTAAIGLLGAFPHLEIGEYERLTLWWLFRGTVCLYVAGATLLTIFYSPRRAGAPVNRWAAAGLVPLGAACVWITYLDPDLPLTWFLLLPALVAGSMLSPRGAAVYALYVAVLSALATLLPVNQFGYEGFLPGSVIIDALVTVSTFITIHLSILRIQRVEATAQLQGQRIGAEEQALLLGTVIETMTDGLIVLGPRSEVVLHNTAARHLMGRSIPLGEPRNWIEFFELTHPDGRPLDPTSLDFGDSGRFHGEMRAGDRLLGVTSWPLGHRGERTVVLFSDVTAERERLAELTSFAGVVAHDLRSPLTSLTGWLELADESIDDDLEGAREAMARARVGSARMHQVIEDWLAYTVQRDGVLTKTKFALAELIEEVVASYGPSEDGTTPEFLLTAAHEVMADRVLTKQLLANLIGNAVKYTPAGKRPQVQVRSFVDAEAGFVRIEVSDRGIGLPPGEEEKIFDEFHRAPAHAESFSGTGLGLALCRRIVVRHGGTIHARNNPIAGSTFSFTLPAA